MKVKMFREPYVSWLEKDVNAFIKDKTIKEMQYQSVLMSGGSIQHSVMIVYE